MALDRNGDPIVLGTDYVVAGGALKELADGRVLLAVGKKVVPVDAGDVAPVASLGGGGGGVTDHGALTGLGDDDHTHYHTDARGDARYSALGHVHAGADITTGTVAAARLPAATTTTSGIVELATSGESAAGVVVQGDDARLADPRTPTAHASSHQHGGSDEVATATPAANGIPKAGAGGTIAAGWLPTHTHAEADVTGLVADLAARQPLDGTLTALAALDATAGLLEQTGADTFARRALGVAAGTSVPTRADADARYDAIGDAAAAVAAHAAAANPHTVYQLMSSKGAASGYASLDGSALVPTTQLPAATTSVQGAVIVGTGAGSRVPRLQDFVDAEDPGNAGQPCKMTSGGLVPAHTHPTLYQPLDSELTAIAGLTSAADRLPYFTGSGTASLATLTSTGRSLIDDTSTSAMRTTLGLGTAAVLNQGVGLTDLIDVQTAMAAFAGIINSWTYVRITSDQSTTSTSAVDITSLAISMTASARYEVKGCLLMRCANTSQSPRFTMAFPSGMTDGVGSLRFAVANGTYPTLSLNSLEAHGNIAASFTTLSGTFPDTTSSYPCWVDAYLVAGASPSGSWKLQFYSSGGASVTVKAGSWIAYRSVP